MVRHINSKAKLNLGVSAGGKNLPVKTTSRKNLPAGKKTPVHYSTIVAIHHV